MELLIVGTLEGQIGAASKIAIAQGGHVSLADNEDSVCEYVNRLAKVNEKVSDRLMIIPRIYTNKPRTTGEGYKGMLHQPEPDQAPDLLAGIIAIRKMHTRAIEESGLTAADEMLYPENRSYLDDILSYEAIGARSVENQQHRLTASGMDIPVGMKNPTSGDFSVMLNSVVAAQSSHTHTSFPPKYFCISALFASPVIIISSSSLTFSRFILS